MSDKYFTDFVGNQSLISRLSRDIEENLLSHAYILEGPRGSGRHKLALSATAAISCTERGGNGGNIPCGKCKNCEKILGGKSPDIITIGLEGERATIGVEAVRQLKNDIYIAPNDLSVKVYIIENADCMTTQAQNAFLLSLEEPPSYIIFFLICENSSLLLETVRSRAPTLRTERIGEKELESYLLSHDKRARELKESSFDQWKELLCVSSGSIGYATELLDSKCRKQIFEYRRFAKEVISALSSSDKAAAFEAITAFGSKRQDVIYRLSFLQYALRDLILLQKCDTAPLCFFESRETAAELSTHFTSKALFDLYDASAVAEDDLERNANVRLTLINMLQSTALI